MNSAPLLEILSLLASMASLLLAVIAIWLSMHFYHKSKATELSIESSLAGITAQANALERISGRQLSSLVRAVTSPDPVLQQAVDGLIRLRLQDLPSQTLIPSGQEQIDTETTVIASFNALVVAYGLAQRSNVLADILREIGKGVGTKEVEEIGRKEMRSSYRVFARIGRHIESARKEALLGKPAYESYLAILQKADSVKDAPE